MNLLSSAKATENSRLLDLGCGPGRVSIPLASGFGEVWAVDPFQEMIDEGRRRTPPELANRLRWIRSRAEDLSADDGYFHLVTIGEAFHRMDQRLVAGRAYRWLTQQGCIAILWYEHIWSGDEAWKRRITEIISDYAKLDAPAASSEPQNERFMTFEEVLSNSGFEDVRRQEFGEPRWWNVEMLIGYLHSVSILSLQAMGKKAADFDREVRRVLLDTDPSGRYFEKARFGLITGMKRGC